MFQERLYRADCTSPLKKKIIVDEESDLLILYSHSIDGAEKHLNEMRKSLKAHIAWEREFLTSLVPLPLKEEDGQIPHQMKIAAVKANVGPMAAVAGAVSNEMGRHLGQNNSDIIIENGGDLFIKTSETRQILIHAGSHPLSDRIAIQVTPEMGPLGICTSSGKMGHSLSFGNADAVVAVSADPLLADAAATSIGNQVKTAEDIHSAIEYAKNIPGLIGVLILCDEKIGMWGGITLTRH